MAEGVQDGSGFVSGPAYGSAAPVLRATGLIKRFGRRLALAGVNFELQPGEALLLLGENGAGKSTLLHLCAGVLGPDAGEVTVAGASVREPAARAAIGFVPQALAIYPRLSVRENLAFFARVLGAERAEIAARVDYGLRVARLAARAGDPARALSGGMQRRLNFACAVLHRPAVLLLDEPTAGVDAASRELLYAAIDEQRRAGAAIVWATHRLEEAERLGARVLRLRGGGAPAAGDDQEGVA